MNNSTDADFQLADLTQNEFLIRNRIDPAEWTDAQCDWEELKSIALDHQKNIEQLESSAELFARLMQKCPAVHSVRWRIKSPEHLMAKIIRKKAEKSDKYEGINTDNYHEIITDLIGIRALHLFKTDCIEISEYINKNLDLYEKPIAYIRQGDNQEIGNSIYPEGLDIKEHPAGYRSIHYVFSSKPTKKTTIAELQVRTIFEEGWSEIDHTIRYPNHSENYLICSYLTIFNRLAGSADEMGSFVMHLADALETQKQEQIQSQNKIEVLLDQLEHEKENSANSKQYIQALKKEISISSQSTKSDYNKYLGQIKISAELLERMKHHRIQLPDSKMMTTLQDIEQILAKSKK